MYFRLVTLALLLFGSPAWAEPALWVARGPHATVYLFGSVHMLRPGTKWPSLALRRAFDDASECWFEIKLPGDPKTMAQLMQQVGFDPGHRLSALLTTKQDAQLKALVQRAGPPTSLDAIEGMRPWLAALVLMVQPLASSGYDPDRGPDAVLQHNAVEKGKKVAAFETFDGQMHMLADLPNASALGFLASTLDDGDQGPALLDAMVAQWMAGKADELADTASKSMREEAPELFKAMFTDRNLHFADAVQGLLMGSKTVLVTVGAAHFAGPGNVRELLQARGIEVERVPD